jgi:archaetidylinositol phosphate synthase
MSSTAATMNGQAGPSSPTTRHLAGLLSTVEKQSLVWMAVRLPQWVNADHLTALGLLAMLLAGLSYWLGRWHPVGLVLVVFWLVVNWLGDSLDGTVARVRNRQRPRYGFYVDHVVDAFGTLFLVGGMALGGFLSPLLALGLLLAYFMLAIEAYLATCARGVFRMSFWGFGPTELRVIIAIGSLRLIASRTSTLWGRSFLLFDVGAVVATVCMAVTLVIAVVRNASALYREEPLPRHGA